MSSLELRNESGLSTSQLATANDLLSKCPELKKVAIEINELEYARAGKYWTLCAMIRNTRLPVAAGAVRMLNRREVSIMLLSLGYPKQRITEINRVVEVSQEMWDKMQAEKVAFASALKALRGTAEASVPAAASQELPREEGESDEDYAERVKVAKAKPINPKTANALPKKVQDALVKFLSAHAKSMPIHKDPYELTYEFAGEKPVRFQVRIFADAI